MKSIWTFFFIPILMLVSTNTDVQAQDEIAFGTLDRLSEQNVLLEIELKKSNLTSDSFVAELNGETLAQAVEIMARAASDDPRPDAPTGSDDPRPDAPTGSDDPRPDGVVSDDPRPDGVDPVTGTPKVIVVESTIGKNSAYLRGFRNANIDGKIVRIPFVRTFKRVKGVWKISAWLEGKQQ